MVSLRVLEREQVIQAERRESIDWEHVRLVTIGRLRKQGFDVDRAEELTQAAIVAVYSGNVRISLKRAVKDVFAECYGILHAEVAERGETGQTLPEGMEVESSRHTEQRTAYGSATENARNGIKAIRDERRLFDRFGWLISQAIQTVVPEPPLMRYLSELAYSAFGNCQDTTQLPPNTRGVIVRHLASLPVVPFRAHRNGIGSDARKDIAENGASCFVVTNTVTMQPESFQDAEQSDRELCRSVSQQFRDCVPFRVDSEREAVLLQMLHG